jgi:hypothetical protein
MSIAKNAFQQKNNNSKAVFGQAFSKKAYYIRCLYG